MDKLFDLLKSSPELNEPTSMMTILLSLFAATLLVFPVALVYMKTRKKEGYAQSFVHAIIFISPIVAAVMLIIGNNLARAFGLVGAVSIIRFRTKMKDPKDTTFIFLCIAIGMACGLRLYYIGLITAVFVSCLTLFLWKIGLGKSA